MANPVGWFEIYVQDIQRAKRFYEQVLAIELDQLPVPDIEMWAFPNDMTQYGSGGTLVCIPGMSSGGNSTLVYFSCQDCAVEESRVKEAGGQVQRSKMSIGQYGFISLIFDTEGNMLGLHSLQ